jgi:hypothetical protein
MFCPECGCEYREGFTECADCHVPLQDTPPPPEVEPEYVDFIPVMATYNIMDISIVKGALESEDIPHFFEGETFNVVRPLVQPARLFVPRDRAEEAVAVLKTLDLKFFALSGWKASDLEDSDDSE